MTVKQHLADALRRLCDTQGGPEAVADAIGSSAENLKQILSGVKLPSGRPRGIGPGLADRLESAFPGWANPPAPAQSVSLSGATMPPQKVAWEALMNAEGPDDLPERFTVALPDNSMSPAAPAGSVVTFRRCAEATAGDGVLVRDRRGAVYFRECRTRADGSWFAHAYDAAFPSLDAQGDGLRVLAVFVGIELNWSALLRATR